MSKVEKMLTQHDACFVAADIMESVGVSRYTMGVTVEEYLTSARGCKRPSAFATRLAARTRRCAS